MSCVYTIASFAPARHRVRAFNRHRAEGIVPKAVTPRFVDKLLLVLFTSPVALGCSLHHPLRLRRHVHRVLRWYFSFEAQLLLYIYIYIYPLDSYGTRLF